MTVQYNNRLRGRTVMVLPSSCLHNDVNTMGNCRHKVTVLEIPLGCCVVTNDQSIKAKKICAPAIFYHAPSRAFALLVQGHNRDPQPGNQSPRRSLALWAVVTNDSVLDDAERNQIM